MKKMNYLNIALEADRSHSGDDVTIVETPLYPDSPLWPKKGLLALWGFALGFMGSLSIAAMLEYFNRTTLRAVVLAERLGVPLLGALPVIPWNVPLSAESRN
jgi:capsular polysaccharide biosynthesis protein